MASEIFPAAVILPPLLENWMRKWEADTVAKYGGNTLEHQTHVSKKLLLMNQFKL